MDQVGHSILPPSSAHRWSNCFGSVLLEAAQPSEDSDESLKGTVVHQRVAERLQGQCEQRLPEKCRHIETDAEMREAIDFFVSECMRLYGQDQQNVFIERPVHIPQVHSLCYGTPDLVIVTPDVLFMNDFKYGHLPVDPYRNNQLACYTAPYLDGWYGSEIVFRIFQPRAYGYPPMREWRTTRAGIESIVWQLRIAAINAVGNDPKLMPTPSGCRDCRVRYSCNALQFVTLGAIDQAMSVVHQDLTPQALGRELTALTDTFELMKARLAALEEKARSNIKAGSLVPGWTLEGGNGRLDWTKPDADVIAVGKLFGIDLTKPTAAVTPTQAKKAGIPEEMLKTISDRKPGELKLVKREAWRE